MLKKGENFNEFLQICFLHSYEKAKYFVKFMMDLYGFLPNLECCNYISLKIV